jgi:hypothetical protein
MIFKYPIYHRIPTFTRVYFVLKSNSRALTLLQDSAQVFHPISPFSLNLTSDLFGIITCNFSQKKEYWLIGFLSIFYRANNCVPFANKKCNNYEKCSKLTTEM